jgi:hypothetical protein
MTHTLFSTFGNNTSSSRMPTFMNSILLIPRLVAILFSFQNVIVFLNKKLKNSVYRLLLVMATVDTLYGILVFSLVVTMCAKTNPNECSPYLYLAHLLSFIIISEYLTSCLAFFNILLEIFLTVERMCLISNIKIYRYVSVKKICLILLVISLAFYTPVLFINRITSSYSTSAGRFNYKLIRTVFGKTTYAKWISIGLNSTRIALVLVVLLILNIIAILKFNAYFERKARLKSIEFCFV